jgi:hypothetical protein
LTTGKSVLVCDPGGKASSFLQYNGSVIDGKGLFVLDKMHGNKTNEEIVEAASTTIIESMKAGSWTILELGKAAPQFGQFTTGPECAANFPLAEILSQNYGASPALLCRCRASCVVTGLCSVAAVGWLGLVSSPWPTTSNRSRWPSRF